MKSESPPEADEESVRVWLVERIFSDDEQNLGVVHDPETRERYATEATRVADEHAPDDTL